jgi:RNA 3'-terminal phosphate cyclase (ATP)
MSDLLTIDGSFGEGGGQILRSSLALSMLTGRPLRLENIRANRDKPGLRRQHLTAVIAAARISGAKVDGAAVGSNTLEFWPGEVRAGEYTVDIGSAGSTTLVFQAVLPALLAAPGPSTLTLVGGTHNPGGPPLDFLERAFLPLVRRMGPGITVTLDRPGFAPAGGGRWTVRVEPAARLTPLHLIERGNVRRRTARAVLAGLPRHIAERELATVAEVTRWPASALHMQELPAEWGPGNVVMLEVESERITEVFSSVGRRGTPAEKVARDAAMQAVRYLESEVPVGDCLADQLLLPMAVAGKGSYVTLPLTRHAQTHIEVIRMFLDVPVATREVRPGAWQVEVG